MKAVIVMAIVMATVKVKIKIVTTMDQKDRKKIIK